MHLVVALLHFPAKPQFKLKTNKFLYLGSVYVAMFFVQAGIKGWSSWNLSADMFWHCVYPVIYSECLSVSALMNDNGSNSLAAQQQKLGLVIPCCPVFHFLHHVSAVTQDEDKGDTVLSPFLMD